MKLITVKTDKSGITVRIPRTLLNHVARSHPEFPVKIHDSQKFMEEVAEEIKDGLGDPHSGLTGLQRLIDEAIEAVVDSGTDSIGVIDVED
jgi:hypothetical protein